MRGRICDATAGPMMADVRIVWARDTGPDAKNTNYLLGALCLSTIAAHNRRIKTNVVFGTCFYSFPDTLLCNVNKAAALMSRSMSCRPADHCISIRNSDD